MFCVRHTKSSVVSFKELYTLKKRFWCQLYIPTEMSNKDRIAMATFWKKKTIIGNFFEKMSSFWHFLTVKWQISGGSAGDYNLIRPCGMLVSHSTNSLATFRGTLL